MVVNMHKANIDLLIIAEVTGLTIDQVKEIILDL